MKKIMHRLKSFLRGQQKHRKAFTILETVAAITIISLVLVSAFTIAINARLQLLTQERRLIAQQEISLIRTQVMARMDTQNIKDYLEGNEFSTVRITLQEESENLALIIENLDENQEVIINETNGPRVKLCDADEDDDFHFICDIFVSESSLDYVNKDIQITLTLNTGVIDYININVTARYHANREIFVEGRVFVQITTP